AIFVVSFAATVLYDVIEGLMIGVCFAAALLVYAILRDAAISEGICCVRFSAPLVYINAEHFKKNIEEIVRLPALERRRREDENEREKSLRSSRHESGTTLRSIKIIPPESLEKKPSLASTKHEPVRVRAIVIDLSTVPHIDVTGAKCLIEIFNEQHSKDVSVLCAAAP
ncbi:STAS domain protein, partial [Ancylostoma duodenale]